MTPLCSPGVGTAAWGLCAHADSSKATATDDQRVAGGMAAVGFKRRGVGVVGNASMGDLLGVSFRANVFSRYKSPSSPAMRRRRALL
jgi:hypothetical protein